MPIDPIEDVALANDKFRTQLRSTWIASPADTSLLVKAVPTNVPTYVTVGWNTDLETIFLVTGKSGDSSANYALTGVTRIKGANVNLPENTPVNILNNEEFFNQYEEKINEVIDNVNTALETVYTGGDFNLTGTNPNVTVGGADPWRTISLTPGFLKPATTSPCGDPEKLEAGTNDIDYDVLPFDSAQDEVAYVNFPMPESWDAGVIKFRYIWTNASGLTTETVQFELSGRAFADDDAIDQAVGTAVAVNDTWIAQNDIHYSVWSDDVTLAGSPSAGDWVHLEIMRDISDDNLTGDARLIAVQIKYKTSQYTD